MTRLLTVFVYLLCFVLNASVDAADSMESRFFDVQAVKKISPPDSQENLSLYYLQPSQLSKGFRPPKGGVPKGRAPKPKGGGKEAPRGGHDKNQREGNREKHENGDARRQREQRKAEEKKERNKKK